MEPKRTGVELSRPRKRIDAIDQQIVELLNQRAEAALEIAGLKKGSNRPNFAPVRESEVFDGVIKNNQGPLTPSTLKQVFTEIISACRGVQGEFKAAFLGPLQTFSHQATLQRFGKACMCLPQPTISQVFDQVEKGLAQVGVVPVENSTEGGVGQTLDRLYTSSLKVSGEIFTLIRHNLIGADVKIEQVEKVYSHPQALAQCTHWLNRNLPTAILVETASTAKAAAIAAQEKNAAAIASLLAAQSRGLNVLADSIQDDPGNLTRFLVLTKKDCPTTGNDKTSLAFMVPHRPGSLNRALDIFARADLNLTKVESRPCKNRRWEYAFFVDFLGHKDDPAAAEALAELKNASYMMRVFGSYPRGEEPLP
ncbi:prephenate dehydratase [Dethiosulfatarculus sandiegensis]|uniref:Bifunctional chorismate mutase/prephenate dehydratase n=1 Tax=Dethiosulfatarculus sandiegensis TaxID=1429043 RepID=A0A0D2JAP2_9BACT|nr:prephenate dehydratase [Dethiosulfatarculus sandiegensis]KIX12801.1 prephenate dehydratase [Dethiosulfatarculus sandiegensis]